MCGASAKVEYKPGRHFISKEGFTKRATLTDHSKRFCDFCQIEFQLINNLINSSGFQLTDDLLFFYFYFDSVFFNVDMFSDQMNKVDITVQETTTGKLGLNFRLSEFKTPFHIKPLAIKVKQNVPASKSTRRARAIITAIKACLEGGCKCVMTSPYTLIRTYSEVFRNERPTTLEKRLNLGKIENFKDAKRIVECLKIINELDGQKGLYRVQSFEPITVIPFIKNNTDNFEMWVYKKGKKLNELFGDEIMEMKKIAEKGLVLYGRQPVNSGTYKRVKIFRTTLDALIAAKAQGFQDNETIRIAAAEVFKDVDREKKHDKYSSNEGRDFPKESLDFVESIVEYLKKNNLWDVKKISHWSNSLTDVYEFEYLQVPKINGDDK